MTTEPSRYVEPHVDDARVERVWRGIVQRSEPRDARRWLWSAGLGIALAAAAFALFRGNPEPPASPALAAAKLVADARLQTATEELSVKLSDGSSLEIAAQSEVEVRGSKSDLVSLALRRGSVTCEVTHRAGRAFHVIAGDVEVRVVGTKFTVKSDGGDLPRVEVSVLRGVVEVASRRQPGAVARVAAGQSWIQNAQDAAEAAEREKPPQPATAPAPSVATPLPSVEAQAGPSARELFEKAGERRRAGDAAGAARAYEELLRAHPGDARSSLAAFELGRLRMDRLGDGAGAIAALERALASSLGPSFREDALARLVSAYAAQGNFAACSRVRDRYLASYPTGVHAAAVATRCGSR